MYEAVQSAHFLLAKNPSEESTLITLAEESGLDADRFAADLGSAAMNQQLANELTKVREFGVTGFPSLIWQWRPPGDESSYGLLSAGYTDLDRLQARRAELVG